MLYRLRTLLAGPWLRFRLSLLSFLLGSTLVAVIVAHWIAVRDVTSLRLQVAALRAENKGFRDQLGLLTVSDPALPHAIYSPQSQYYSTDTWQWKFYAPQDRPFRLCLAYDGIGLNGMPTSDAKIVVLADNLPVEGVVTCFVYQDGIYDPQSAHVAVEVDDITKKVDLPHDSSVWVRSGKFEREIYGENATINAAAGQPLVLLRLRGYRITEVEQNGGVKARPILPPDDSPGPGILLWIEEQPGR